MLHELESGNLAASGARIHDEKWVPGRRDIVLGSRWATATKCRPGGNPGDQQECHGEYDDVKELGKSEDDSHAKQSQYGDDRARQPAGAHGG